jgi:hypothetical protein
MSKLVAPKRTIVRSRRLGIEVSANLAEASAAIMWRPLGEEQWRPTVYQTADAAHKRDRALRLVNDWLEDQQ